jgi:hypothetical protein
MDQINSIKKKNGQDSNKIGLNWFLFFKISTKSKLCYIFNLIFKFLYFSHDFYV